LAIFNDPSAVLPEQPLRRATSQDGLRQGLWARFTGSTRRRKAISLGIALVIEALIVLLLFTLGTQIAGDENGKEDVKEFTAIEFAAPEPEPAPEPDAASQTPPTPQEPQPQPDQPLPQPLRPSPLALSPQPAPPPPPPAPAPPQETPPQPNPSPTIGARINPGRSYGPVDSGNPRTTGDSERVGTAPNGEPLYAARWYREPTRQELAGYLSTASGPGSALIACKTVPDYYVEDCVLLGESPPGSQIGRAVMAAAWQFRVRPARIGGREQFGSWVRIRIDYSVSRTPR
jgi:periplasmic protein TonB